MARHLMTDCWSEESSCLRKQSGPASTSDLLQRSDFQSAKYSLSLSQLKGISIDLQVALDILKEVNEAGREWSQTVAVQSEEVIQELTERHLVIRNKLELLSSSNIIPDNLRGPILQLLADTFDAITAEIHQLINDVGMRVPHVIDNVLNRYRVDTVLESINDFSDVLSWNERLRLVTEEISCRFSLDGDEMPSPDENATFRGTRLDYDSKKYCNDSEQVIIDRIQLQWRCIADNVDHASQRDKLRKNN